MAAAGDLLAQKKSGGVITVAPDATVKDAARLMHDHRIGSLVVADGESLRGIFTERDVLWRVGAQGKDAASTTGGEGRRAGGVFYPCGPVVAKETDHWQCVAAGPTTSIREEVYQDLVIEHFNVKAVIGKGGMGPRTLAACQKQKAVYLHAVGGAGTLIAETVKEVEIVQE